MLVKDIMSKNLITVKESDTLQHAAELMQQYDIGILPVVCDGKLCGVITDRDIVTRGVCKSKDVCDIPVSNCMSKSTVCANPDQQVEDAAKTMAAQQVRRVPVTENGCLCGILSIGDISKNSFDTEVAKAMCEISKP
ncbi:MAG: CBS domain-containing protein [Oscillospiraceae bacterium]|nr:CBS domain-containing protein [Oscillospiraceae bacterium]